jgi:hypothetical protein
MNTVELLRWTVALHHRTNVGENARHLETVERWLQQSADSFEEGRLDGWFVIGIAPTNEQARMLLDAFEQNSQN